MATMDQENCRPPLSRNTIPICRPSSVSAGRLRPARSPPDFCWLVGLRPILQPRVDSGAPSITGSAAALYDIGRQPDCDVFLDRCFLRTAHPSSAAMRQSDPFFGTAGCYSCLSLEGPHQRDDGPWASNGNWLIARRTRR